MEPLACQSMHSVACDSQSPSVTSTSKSCGPVPRPCQEVTAVGRRSQRSSAASQADVLASSGTTCNQASIRGAAPREFAFGRAVLLELLVVEL